jgi:hypothetical protein
MLLAANDMSLAENDGGGASPQPPPDAAAGIVRFVATPAATPLGQDTTLEWALVKPAGAALTCVIRYDEPGAADETIPDCPAAWHVQHRYIAVGKHAPTLTLLSNDGQREQIQTSLEIFEGLRIEVVSPTVDQVFGTDAEVKVQARLLASRPFASATATVGATSATLIADADMLYAGSVSLSPNQASLDLVVRAQTTAGETAESTVHIYQTLHAPKLIIHAPLLETVARPTLDLDLACVGDVPGCDLTVYIDPVADNSTGTMIASGSGQIKTTVDLGQWTGLGAFLLFKTSNGHGGVIEVWRHIFVENSSWYKELRALPEGILDADLTATPWRFVRSDLSFGEAATEPALQSIQIGKPYPIALHVDGQATDTRIFDGMIGDGLGHSYSDWVRLAPGAVLYASYDQLSGQSLLTRWAGSASPSYPVSALGATFAGDYLAFADGHRLETVRLSTGAVTVLADSGDEIAVSQDGVVAYASFAPKLPEPNCNVGPANAKLYLSNKLIASDSTTPSYYTKLQTDGQLVAYAKRTYVVKADGSCGVSQQIAIHDGTNETLIGPSVTPPDIAVSGSEIIKVNHGWVAFVLPDSYGVLAELWRRSPSGVVERLAKTSAELQLEGLGDDGSVIYRVDWIPANERSYVSPSGRTTWIGHGLGRAFFSQGNWYILIGRSLFQLSL